MQYISQDDRPERACPERQCTSIENRTETRQHEYFGCDQAGDGLVEKAGAGAEFENLSAARGDAGGDERIPLCVNGPQKRFSLNELCPEERRRRIIDVE